VIKKFTTKKTVYENGKMYAPDGELLSNTDYRKAMWYVDKGLAVLTSKDPLIITLKFEPSGKQSN
jgi:exonuclease 3'-5' domain-containing protein 2